MWYRLQRTLVCLAAVICLSLSASSVQAGWGHRWGHHHHHHYYGGSYIGFGFPSYSYSSFYFSAPRARFYYPLTSVGFYSSYHVPTYSYSVALPSYYYAPSYYVAPTYYTAPLVIPSSNCCDPCASVSYPSVSYPSTAPVYSQPEYSTGVESPASVRPSQFASSSGGSFVDRMLGRYPTPDVTSPAPLRSNTSSIAAARTSDGSVRTVSTLKPVAPSTAPPANIDQLTPVPESLLKTADEMFALGGYEQAASAYARLAVRFGNHDALAVRRFIALVASGDHASASIVCELAMANGRPLSADALPGGLAQLYGANAAIRKNHIESLAAFALQSSSEALPLQMVASWLELDGQAERAATFKQRADMLSQPTAPASPTLANRLVDAMLAR